MEAVIAPFDEMNLSRIVQLIGKTNQFNLTTRRHGVAEVRAFMDDDRYVTSYLRLRDRFGDHGLVALMIAEQQGEIDGDRDVADELPRDRTHGRECDVPAPLRVRSGTWLHERSRNLHPHP